MDESTEKLALGLALTVVNDDPESLAEGLRPVVADQEQATALLFALLTISGTLIAMVGQFSRMSGDEVVAALLDSYKDS